MAVLLRSRALKSGSKSFYLDIHHNGERWREFLKIRSSSKDPSKIEKKRLAETIRAHREVELLSVETNYVPNHQRNLDFFLFAEGYLEDYPCKDGRMIESAVKKFKLAIGSSKIKLSDITPKHMETFKNYLIHKSGLTGETPNNYFTRFKKVLKAAKVEGFIKVLPTEGTRYSFPNREDTIRKQVLDQEELQKLADTRCGNPNVKRAFLFACYTSLGFAEIKDLKWANINKGRLITHRNKTGELINNRLNSTAISILGEPKKKEDYVFDLQDLSTNGLNKTVKNWVIRASIDKHITFYCARHTFACLLLLSGANLKTVADAMGHSSTKSTLKYLNFVNKLQDEAIDNLPNLDIA